MIHGSYTFIISDQIRRPALNIINSTAVNVFTDSS